MLVVDERLGVRFDDVVKELAGHASVAAEAVVHVAAEVAAVEVQLAYFDAEQAWAAVEPVAAIEVHMGRANPIFQAVLCTRN